MAETTTVYPFGSGGEMPSSLSVVNDLVTGGADKLLSAEAGKELGKKVRVIFDDMESTHTASSQLGSSAVGNGLLEYNPTTHKILYFYMASAGDTYATCIEGDPDPRIFYGDINNNIYRWNTPTTAFVQVGGSSVGGVAGSGDFADAYDYAKQDDSAVFQWILIDSDSFGNVIKKMVWHIGDLQFIDAIGATINGIKNGITIKATESGYVTFKGGELTTTAGQLGYINGETNYSFAEVANILKTANAAPSSTYDGKSLSIVDASNEPTSLEIDFGWAIVGTSGLTKVTHIKRMNVGSSANLASAFRVGTFGRDSYSSRLKYIQLKGKTSALNRCFAAGSNSTRLLQEIDASGLSFTSGATTMSSFCSLQNPDYNLIKVDIRGLDTSSITDISSLFFKCYGLKTLIIGNFTFASSVSATNAFYGVTGLTVVCTTDTPPAIGYNWIAGHVSSIKIPNKTVEVENNGETETVELIDVYKTASGWSTYADIMSTYEEGEY